MPLFTAALGGSLSLSMAIHKLRASGSTSLRSVSLVAAVLTVLVVSGWTQTAGTSVPAALTSAQIVDRMLAASQARADALQHYQSLRHYEVEYRGFGTAIVARMAVEAEFDAATGKSFHIVSQSGSKVLLEKVLKRALDSELDAGKDQNANALTPANYRFHLDGTESLRGGPSYVLDVEPVVATKYLYRGKIWVDATDFAVARMEVEPAKNPSFFIARTNIHQKYAKTGQFWLPEQNRSESKVRVGGTALLTIDYGAYQIAP